MRNSCILFFALITTTLHAQIEESAFGSTGRGGTATTFVTDYQAIGINPANLGFDNGYGMSFGVMEFGYSFYSDALLRDDVREVIFNNDDSISAAEQELIAEAFVENGMSFNLDVMPVGFSIRIPKFGTLGLSYKVNSTYRSEFGGAAPQIIFEGYDYAEYFDTVIFDGSEIYAVAYEPLSLSDLFDGTSISFNATSEINLAYGTRIIDSEGFDLFGGLGIKYVMSHAYFNMEASDGKITGISALGLDILELSQAQTPYEITENALQPVGSGWGFDLGLSIKIGEVVTLGAAITDIGKIKYTANVLEINDYVLDTLRFGGVTSTDPIEIIEQILADENIISYSGIGSFEDNLATNFRIGGSLAFGMLDVGIDVVIPLNDVPGAYTSPVIGFGGELTLFEFVKPSAGITTGGGYDFNVPAGLTLDFKIWELGIASRDILTWFGEKRPTVSFAFGFLRFKI